MRLVSYPDRALRLEKVVRHYYDQRERWWEVVETDLVQWSQEWNRLRAVGVGWQQASWTNIVVHSEEDVICDQSHTRWHAAAEQACEEAKQNRTVFPADKQRRCYVGDHGVTVYVAGPRTVPRLVTCFRVFNLGARRSGKIDRSAVRRAARRASWKL